MTKDARIAIRISQELLEALKKQAQKEQRSLSNLINIILEKSCKK